MIYIVIFNLFVDYIVYVEDFIVGGLNCFVYDIKYSGGKGINVLRLLKRYYVLFKVFGFVGGFIGEYIKIFLWEENLEIVFFEVKEDICINVKLKIGDEIEINGQGLIILDEDFKVFLEQF